MIHSKLLEFQKKKVVVAKGGKNPAFHSNYSELEDVLEAVTGPLNEVGIVLLQLPQSNGLTTKLIDAEDSTEVEGFVPYVDLSTMQKVGSSITYARRYSIVAMLGLKEVDDDGNAASGTSPQPTSYASSRTSVPGKPANALPQGSKENILDGVHNVTVVEVYNGTSKASGKDYQKVTTDKGSAFNNVRPARSMEVGKAYTVTVSNGGITAATTPRDAVQVVMDAPYPEEGDPSDIPF